VHARRGDQRLAPYAIVFDESDPISRDFAAHSTMPGLPTLAIGDVSSLWYRELRSRWLPSGRRLVGMTHVAQLLCLEQFACDAGRYLVFRSNHREQAASHWEHLAYEGASRPAGAIPRVSAADLQRDCRVTWVFDASDRRSTAGSAT
jgi:hypothetical protein